MRSFRCLRSVNGVGGNRVSAGADTIAEAKLASSEQSFGTARRRGPRMIRRDCKRDATKIKPF